eukprot:2687064-Prymnesium_polylepis.1
MHIADAWALPTPVATTVRASASAASNLPRASYANARRMSALMSCAAFFSTRDVSSTAGW